MKSSLIFVGFFLAGCLAGYTGAVPPFPGESDLSLIILCALLFLVGLSIGNDTRLRELIRASGTRTLLVPLATVAGTLAGAAVIGLVLPHWSMAEWMAAGSGMGYYSLSSLLIVDLKSASIGLQQASALGAIALLSNLLRELITLLGAPLLVRAFGPLAPINAGGATTMDSTLAVITRSSGSEWILTSLIHGILTDLSVPFLVTLFCSL